MVCKNKNQREGLNKFKYEVAQEMGLSLKNKRLKKTRKKINK